MDNEEVEAVEHGLNDIYERETTAADFMERFGFEYVLDFRLMACQAPNIFHVGDCTVTQ